MSIEEKLGEVHRYELQDRYLELTRVEHPAEASRRGWVVTEGEYRCRGWNRTGCGVGNTKRAAGFGCACVNGFGEVFAEGFRG